MTKLNKRQQELLDKMPPEQRAELLRTLGVSESPKAPAPHPGAKKAEQEKSGKAILTSTREELPRMNVNNPFNALGLLAGVPEKEIARRKAQINAYLNVGKELSFEEDIPWAVEGLDRSREVVNAAFASIEQYSSRALYGFGWFVEGSRADGPALAHLRAGDTEKARDIWYRVAALGELTEQSISCASNLGTLTMLTGLENMETFAIGVNWKVKVLGSPLLPTLLEKLGDQAVAQDVQGFIRAWGIQLSGNVLQKYGGQPAAMQRLGSCFDGANPSTLQLLREPFEEHYAKTLDRLVAGCKAKRKGDKANAHKHASGIQALAKCELDAFRAFSGIGSASYQHSADQVAEELLECAIDHWNECIEDDTVDIKAVQRLVTDAKALAQGRMLKARIDDNWVTMKEHIDDAPERKRAAAVASLLNELKALVDGPGNALDSFDDVDAFITKAQLGLSRAERQLGETDDLYINISSTLVGKAQSALVDMVNHEQQLAASDTINKILLPARLDKALELHKRLGTMAMSTQLRAHYTKNLQVLQGLVDQLRPAGTQRTSRTTGRVQGGTSRPASTTTPAQEPGWLERNAAAITIFVVMGLIIGVCNN
jgi:hypothetical protein